MSLDRDLARACDALAEANDFTRPSLLMDLAYLYEQAATSGSTEPVSDRLVGEILNLLAGVELVATGRLDRRHGTGSPMQSVLDPVLDSMAAEPYVHRRAAFLDQLCALIPDDMAAESIAMLPYAPGMVGWRRETYLPSSFPKMVRALWRARRAA